MSRKAVADMRRAKDARTKKIAIGGFVLLVAVLAFEVPKVLKQGSVSSSPPPATTTTSTTANTPPVGATPTATPTGSTRLPNSDVSPTRSKSELYSFSRFAGKDPFAPQITDLTLGQPDAPGEDAQGNPTQTSSSSSSSSSVPTLTAKTTVNTPRVSPVRTLAASGAVKIQVNGKIETVRVGGSFPTSNPLFRLVSIGSGAVKIGIANGNYASGAPTVALVPGRSVTLVDTADGIRYTILLVSAA